MRSGRGPRRWSGFRAVLFAAMGVLLAAPSVQGQGQVAADGAAASESIAAVERLTPEFSGEVPVPQVRRASLEAAALARARLEPEPSPGERLASAAAPYVDPPSVREQPRLTGPLGELLGPPGRWEGASLPGDVWVPDALLVDSYTSITGRNDPGIAVGHNFVVVVSSGRLAFYGRWMTGALLPNKDGTPVTSSTSIFTLFESFWDPSHPGNINANLNLPPGMPCDPTEPLGQRSTRYCIDQIYDARVAYDPDRKRFILVALARNSKARGDDKPLTILQGRRSFLLAAVSFTEDPRDGWHLWHWPAAVDMGACNNPDAQTCPGTFYRPGDASDYPLIALSPEHLTVVTGVDNVIQAAKKQNKNRYQLIHVIDTDVLTTAEPMAPGKWRFFAGPKGADGQTVRDGMTPVRSRVDGPGQLLVRNAGERIEVYRIPDPVNGETGPIQLGEVELKRSYPTYQADAFVHPSDGPHCEAQNAVLFGNVGNGILNAVRHGDLVHVVANDCIVWQEQSDCATAVRYVRFSVASLPDPATPDLVIQLPDSAASGFFDRAFGRSAQGDPSGTVAHYGMPGIEVTQSGHAVIVFMRTAASIPPEVRYTTLIQGEPDVRPSILVQTGQVQGCMNVDTAGIALDPADPDTVWMTHAFTNASGFQFVVAKTRP